MTHRENFLRKHNLPLSTSLSLAEISELSGIPRKALQEVYNRGTGAYKSSGGRGIRLLTSAKKDYSPGYAGKMSKEQWSLARVYSFVDRGKTFRTTDSDIAKEYGLQ